jgi:hypothetical protein
MAADPSLQGWCRSSGRWHLATWRSWGFAHCRSAFRLHGICARGFRHFDPEGSWKDPLAHFNLSGYFSDSDDGSASEEEETENESDWSEEFDVESEVGNDGENGVDISEHSSV